MELSNEVIGQLSSVFKDANSHDTVLRESATEKIAAFKKNPGAAVTLLIFQNNPNLDISTRLYAAITFKNLVKEGWENSDETENPIPANDKEKVKSVFVDFVLASTQFPSTQAQLLEALSIISLYDFPREWPTILPNLISKFATSDVNVLTIILKMLHTILKKYRGQEKKDSILAELKEILSKLPEPYLALLINTGKLVDVSLQNEAQLFSLLNCIHYLFEIYFSMSSVDLPEFFEDHLGDFTNEFQRYLKLETNFRSIISSKNEEPSLLKKIQTSICEIINLYTQIYDEEFQEYLQPFVESIWTLLTKTSNEISNDPFTYSSIKFLGTVSTSISHKLFDNPAILQQLCSMVITPNIELRESDLELYEDNPVEYMRRDIEGSDSDTRRRAAIELVKGLRKYYETPVFQLLSADIKNLLDKYNQNKKDNWNCKDSAIFLVTALAIKSESNSQLVNIVDFYKQSIEPELSSQDTQPILKADCLKFITIFRSQIPAVEYTRILNHVLPCLQNPDYIIHTYASSCIDRLLAEKNPDGSPRLPSQFVADNLANILIPLANVFSFPCSRQNDRTMKTIVRVVIMTQGKINEEITVSLLQKFISILLEESKNPGNHNFVHYCFEIVGTLLKNIASKPQAPNTVLPLIQTVLQNQVVDFTPYCFQLFSILVENSSQEYLNNYIQQLPMFLTPAVWRNQADYPPLVRLLQAFIKKDAVGIVNRNQLEPILGIFRKLVLSPSQDHEAFFILESLVENLDYSHLEKYLVNIFDVILTRISNKKTQKVVRCFTIFFSIFIIKFGVVQSAQITKSIKPDLWESILERLWLPTVNDINGSIEKKIISICLTNMICCGDILTNTNLWIKLLQCQYNILTGKKSTEADGAVEELYIDKQQEEGYQPTFTQLAFSKKVDVDPFPAINDPSVYFNQMFSEFRQRADNSLITKLVADSGVQL
ncbi:hypothetical protein DICPUDRAFT_97076 [Dictyostelium purpureum]|uniref:Importin N-terminal domain-containing protein n=1 Tax=Dictyostelium purpureum TaxID=5786 RepID=F0ZDP8_DICPU|nr:uncharacterized protein DICPUDRAFT_97076 [Dictyostelium purpureum]EGC37956.1 hypothetical protein DICPUDRAFT_97076 [Dictyostelium purpureum]|eukprot:XP_003285527.1 hypothetical protein DICPUDRAFT_97076 [Dictyostelium purpureum]